MAFQFRAFQTNAFQTNVPLLNSPKVTFKPVTYDGPPGGSKWHPIQYWIARKQFRDDMKQMSSKFTKSKRLT